MLKKRAKLLSVLAVMIVLMIVFVNYQNNHIVISKISLNADVDASFKIVQISDLHSKQFGKSNKKLEEKITGLSPDFIVFTGDIIDGSGKNIDETLDFISTLDKNAPVICIFGNHEWRSGLQDDIEKKMKDKSICILRNEIKTLDVLSNRVNILGLDENQGSYNDYIAMQQGEFEYRDNKTLFDELSKLDGYNIVLSHYPENFALAGGHSYNQFDFDIMFSGHAHGGQFVLPFIGGVYAPGQGFNPPYYKGLYDNRLIVSSGLGNSMFPLRLFNYPEIVEISILKNTVK